ncbi:hypothetical protein RUND412_011172 [Rhizina undulata]
MKFNSLPSVLLGGLSFLAISSSTPVSSPYDDNDGCKCDPSGPCWPSPYTWAALNTTLSGALISTVPLASVCYPDHPKFSREACEQVYTQWSTDALHYSDPASIMWPYWADKPPFIKGPCLPTANGTGAPGGCSLGGYAVYSINATTAEHVIEGIKFAKKYNIRLVVKNTGHDFMGRSTGFGALSIWTHNLRGLEYFDNFVPSGCSTGQGEGTAVSIAAGHQWIDVYREVATKGWVVVGGSERSVGCTGGYLQGGGHSPLSSAHGLAADNVLEFTLVTPSGDLITANSYQNTDIFWALRGGGGGTFGVVLKATVRAYPSPQTTTHLLLLNSTVAGNLSLFWEAVTYIHSQMPTLSDEGFQGYYAIIGMPTTPFFGWQLYLYNRPNGTAEKIFKPIQEKLDSLSIGVNSYSQATSHPTWLEAYEAVSSPIPVGSNTILGDRLLPRTAFEGDQAALKGALIGFVPTGSSDGFTGHLVAGGQVVKNKNLDMALNPAWRDTYVHLVVNRVWDDSATDVEKAKVVEETAANVHAFDSLAPRVASYFNEGDAVGLGLDWKEAYFGGNYGRLARIKEKYDPDGTLWCRGCVRSDEWVVHADGKLCRA